MSYFAPLFELTTWHVVLSVILFCSQFCRAVKTDKSTARAVLLSFYGLTAASIFSMFAPVVLPGWRPSWDGIALLLAIIFVQLVTSRFWRVGTPEVFQHDHAKQHEMG